LAEAAVKGVKKGGKVEVTVNVGGDLAVQMTAREVGGKGGVRGTVEAEDGGERQGVREIRSLRPWLRLAVVSVHSYDFHRRHMIL
jgi:hypothetical protein